MDNLSMTSPPATDAPWQDPLDLLQAAGGLPLESFVTFRVNQLSAAFERQWSRFMREHAGVSLSEWRILAMLQDGPSTSARVVEGTGMNKALLSRSAHQLDSQGLVHICATPGDARSITLDLTPAGRKLLSRVRPLAIERQTQFLSVLTAGERHTLYAALDKLRQAAVDWEGTSGGDGIGA